MDWKMNIDQLVEASMYVMIQSMMLGMGVVLVYCAWTASAHIIIRIGLTILGMWATFIMLWAIEGMRRVGNAPGFDGDGFG
jgi:hypothetical protein